MRRYPKQARSKAKVSAIVESATAHLRDNGYDALSTADVAKDAGVSVGTLYQFFDNKDDLMHAIAENHIEEMLDFREMLFGPDAIYVPAEILIGRAIDWLVAHNAAHPTYEQIFCGSWSDPALMEMQQQGLGGIVSGLALIVAHHAPHLAEDEVQTGATLLVYTTKTMFSLLADSPAEMHPRIITETKRMMLMYFNTLIAA